MPGEKLSNFMLITCLEQLIHEPTHFPRDAIETCGDLVFTDKPSSLLIAVLFPLQTPRSSTKLFMALLISVFPVPHHTIGISGNMTRPWSQFNTNAFAHHLDLSQVSHKNRVRALCRRRNARKGRLVDTGQNVTGFSAYTAI